MNTMRPKQKQIESFLQQVPDFQGKQKQHLALEQYLTPPSIAAQIIHQILMNQQSLDGLIAADFGCGTGMLSAAMICGGIQEVVGYEIDPECALVAKQTISDIHNDDQFDIILANIKEHRFSRDNKIDIIVMNPPFGTKDTPDAIEGGIDSIFLKKAFKLCDGDIYSLHKSSTREYIKKLGEQNGRKFQLMQEIQYPLPKKFTKHHKKDLAYTQVDLVHFLPN